MKVIFFVYTDIGYSILNQEAPSNFTENFLLTVLSGALVDSATAAHQSQVAI